MIGHHALATVSPRLRRGLAAGGLAISLLALPFSASAASRTIEILVSSYSPATLSVQAGATVEFTNTSTLPHTATADNGAFDTGLINPGDSKSVTLSEAGVIAFHCQFHGAVGGVGQSGAITVTAVVAATAAPTANAGGNTGTGGSGAGSPPSTATLPDLPEGAPGLGVLAFGAAIIGSVVLAFAADAARGLTRRRSGR